MEIQKKIESVQAHLKDKKIDGWLLYDFRRSNDLACEFLNIPKDTMLTRRFFYWIPKTGNPLKIVSAIEEGTLKYLPGISQPYRTWQELELLLENALKNSKIIAMEYSPRNAIPYISKVDAGTMDVIRGFDVEVISSADLLQLYTSVWNKQKLESHLFAAKVVDESVEKAWNFIFTHLKNKQKVTEYDVQQMLLREFELNHCTTLGSPICAVNANSANPHYTPTLESHTTIKNNDFILIDLWCRQNSPHATYADITRVGVAASKPTPRQQEIFMIVKNARDVALNLVISRFAEKKPLMGWEVDYACRQIIEDAGYGKEFIHRTGHNIDESDHGNGAHIDSYETQDCRQILPGTCFSIEPGIYLPKEFGVRLEYDVYIHHDGGVQVTGGIQELRTVVD